LYGLEHAHDETHRTQSVDFCYCTVYNTRDCLIKYLNSIVNQEYKKMEIICVDDGFTDRNGQILDDFVKSDFRIKIYHKDVIY